MTTIKKIILKSSFKTNLHDLRTVKKSCSLPSNYTIKKKTL